MVTINIQDVISIFQNQDNMKIINITLLAVIICLTSCELYWTDKAECYKLDICLKDPSGNNILDGIYSISEKSSMTIIFEEYKNGEELESSERQERQIIPDIKDVEGVGHCLSSNLYVYFDFSDIRKITYQIKSPEIFGDEEVREFVTYWDLSYMPRNAMYTKCYRIEYEGKTYTPLQIGDNYSLGVITLSTP